MFLGMARNYVGGTGATGVGPGRFTVVTASRVTAATDRTKCSRNAVKTFRSRHVQLVPDYLSALSFCASQIMFNDDPRTSFKY